MSVQMDGANGLIWVFEVDHQSLIRKVTPRLDEDDRKGSNCAQIIDSGLRAPGFTDYAPYSQ